MTTLKARITQTWNYERIGRELILFAITTFVIAMSASMYDSVFNNFLNDRFTMTGFQRSFLEFPRELPGFLVVFLSAGLWFLCSRRLGVLSMALSAVGALLIAFLSSSYAIMVIWLFIYSTGQHLFMPISSTIGMELAKAGKTGQRLGQLNSVRNIAVISGSTLVVVGFRYLGMTFQQTFVMSAVLFAAAAVLMAFMKRGQVQPAKTHIKLHREYKWFYILAILFGSRKQLFITFAPWVLVTVFDQPTEIIALLITIGGIIGIFFQPLLGWTIDRLGERKILAIDAVLLVFVCFGYGFSKNFFAANVAFIIACVCYVFDQLLFGVGIARSTYLKKIAMDPGDVQPALAASVTIDHVFSISVALLGGVIWNVYGYQYVFLLGMVIAGFSFLTALRITVPEGAQA